MDFDIRHRLSPQGEERAKARAVAMGRDIYPLYGIYNAWVAGKEKPRNPDAAFLKWMENYTKGEKL